MITGRDKLGHITKSSGHPLANINMTLAIQLYQAGFSVSHTAEIIGTNSRVLQRRLKKLNMCRDKGYGNRGRRYSLKHRQNIAKGRKRLLSDPDIKERLCNGENNPFYGHKHKPETIAAMKLKVSKLLSGENNPQWQGGKSLEPYGYEFKRKIRKQVYIRDKYQCQECGVIHEGNSGKLVAHHKDEDKKNCNTDNLITLCRPCHAKITMVARWRKEVAKIL